MTVVYIYTVEFRLERKLGPWSQIVTDSVTVVYILSSLDWTQNSAKPGSLVTDGHRFSDS